MRPSSRSAILDAAFSLAGHDDGAVPITYEAVAKQAGVTKGAVLYHFPTRAELVAAVTRYAAERIELAMAEHLGRSLGEVTVGDRVRAYAAIVERGRVTRADLAIFAEGLSDPALAEPWSAVLGPWLDVEHVGESDSRARLITARLAADGLWMADAINSLVPNTDDRARIVAHINLLTKDL